MGGGRPARRAAVGWRRVQLDPELFRFSVAEGFLGLEEADEPALGPALEPPPGAPEREPQEKGRKRRRAREHGGVEARDREGEVARVEEDEEAAVQRIAAAAAEKAVAAAQAKAQSSATLVDDTTELPQQSRERAKKRKKKAISEVSAQDVDGGAPFGPAGEQLKPPTRGARVPAQEVRPDGDGTGAAGRVQAVPATSDLFAAVAAEFAARKESKIDSASCIPQRPAQSPAAAAANIASQVVERRASLDPVADMGAWAEFGLHERLLQRLAEAGFATPRPIQREVLPAAIHGRRDICGAAETGSGKTLAFGLPIVHRLLELEDWNKQIDGLFALIIAPTRELATQVANHLRAVAPESIQIVSLLGGLSIDKQKRQLLKKPQVVVGTPGRLWELMQDPTVRHLRSIETVRFFVLDEVDRMVEAGHYKELESILRRFELASNALPQPEDFAVDVPSGDGNLAVGNSSAGRNYGDIDNSSAGWRQTFLFSATLMLPPAAREANAKRLQKHKPLAPDSTMDKLLRTIKFYNSMKVVDLTRKQLVATKLTQMKITCLQNEKEAHLYLLLRAHSGRTIIFCNAITCLRRLRSLLALMLVPVFALQGNMQQRARLKALDRFKATQHSVLLATDVAARGLDIPGVQLVIHFQLPRSAEVYVHRAGRTARGDAGGLSVALIDPSEQKSYRRPHSRALRLCLELELANGLPDMPLDVKMLPRVRNAISLARQIDRTTHRESRDAQQKKSRRKLAQEMDLPSDSDDDSDEVETFGQGDRKARQHQQQLKQMATMKEQLAQILKKMAQPIGLSLQQIAQDKVQW